MRAFDPRETSVMPMRVGTSVNNKTVSNTKMSATGALATGPSSEPISGGPM